MGIRIGGVKVFGEVFGFLDFSDVVIESHGTASSGISGVGGAGSGFRQMPDEDAVEIRSGSFEGEAAKNGVIEAGEFKPREVGGAIERGLKNGE